MKLAALPIDKIPNSKFFQFVGNLRQDDIAKLTPVLPDNVTPRDRISGWKTAAEQMENSVFIALVEKHDDNTLGEIVLIFVAFELFPGKFSIGMAGTDKAEKHGYKVARFLKLDVPEFMASEEVGARVCEAHLLASQPKAIKLMRLCGLQCVADLPKEGKGGETFKLFRWVNPNV